MLYLGWESACCMLITAVEQAGCYCFLRPTLNVASKGRETFVRIKGMLVLPDMFHMWLKSQSQVLTFPPPLRLRPTSWSHWLLRFFVKIFCQKLSRTISRFALRSAVGCSTHLFFFIYKHWLNKAWTVQVIESSHELCEWYIPSISTHEQGR